MRFFSPFSGNLFVLRRHSSAPEMEALLANFFHLGAVEVADCDIQCCDTFDWRLWRAGYHLQAVQEHQGFGLSLWHDAGQVGTADISGVMPRFAEQFAPGVLRRRLRKLAGNRALLPFLTVEGRQSCWQLRDEDGSGVTLALIEAELEFARQGEARRAAGIFLQIVPQESCSAEFLRRVVTVCCSLQGVESLDGGLVGFGIEALGMVPGDYQPWQAQRFDASMESAPCVRSILGQWVAVMGRNEHGMVHDLDAEFLHDYRVALRRLRSLLRSMGDVLDAEVVQSLRADLAWLSSRTGLARDLDVFLESLEPLQRQLPPGSGEVLLSLKSLLWHKRRRAYGSLQRLLSSARYARVLDRLNSLVLREDDQASLMTAAMADIPIKQLADLCIGDALARLLKKGDRIRAKSSDEQLHEVRIAAKRLRYLLDIFPSLYGGSGFERAVRALKELQTCLGEFNDVAVQLQALEEYAAQMYRSQAEGGYRLYMALGYLQALLHQRRSHCRGEFARQWKKFADNRVQKHFSAMLGDILKKRDGEDT